MVTTFDLFGPALMINRGNCIYLFKFFLCILSGHIPYYWIISTGYSTHEFGTINILYSPKKKFVVFTPLTPYHGHFPLSPRFPLDCTCISLSFSACRFFSFSIRTTSSNRLTASGSMEVCIYCTWIKPCPLSLKYIAHAGAHKKSLFPLSF